jgi:SAM-dependent methyltransferase
MTARAVSRAAWRPAAVLLLATLPPLSPAADPLGRADVPYVPTPESVVDVMLKLANVGPRDFVVDLGSGDGRILIAAAKKRGARGFGVDIDGALVHEARREAQRQGVAARVEFLEQNLVITDIDRASVLTLYLSSSLMMQLRPRFFRELRPGTRIVSHDFDMEGWQPDARVTVPVPGKPYGPPSSEVYFWVVPANAAGHWRWRSPPGHAAADVELALSQTFQMLEGALQAGAGRGRMEQGRMRGDEIRFILSAEVDGRPLRQEYSGRVSGDTISGRVNLAGGEFDWKATRTRRGSIKLGGE